MTKSTMVFLNEKQKEQAEFTESLNSVASAIQDYQKYYENVRQEEKTTENASFAFRFIMLLTLQPLAFMLLWNWILVPALGIISLNFLQSLGLLVMSRIFIGGKK